MQRILVLGAGFAGLWSAVAAARRLDELGAGEVEVLVVNRTAWHSIRVRNYEADLDATRVPLADVLDPIGVKHVIAEVTDINVPERKVACTINGASQPLHIDWYVTCLDLGPWGAVYTQGWDRQVAAKGAAAKRTKEIINRQRIYPPRSRNRREILDAAAPVVQAPPDQLH
jgi:NADH dehydrogenase FAD-containing subunit